MENSAQSLLMPENMFQNRLDIEIDKCLIKKSGAPLESPLCSSSNTSSSSSKTTNPSESNSTPKFISSTFIPLNQSRILLTQLDTNQVNLENLRKNLTNSTSFNKSRQSAGLNERGNGNNINHQLMSSSSSSSSATSSVVASLSVLSFSESNSISSLSSSISYGDAAAADLENSDGHKTSCFSDSNSKDLKKSELTSSISTSFGHVSSKSSFSLNDSNQINPSKISELMAPYKNKPFYGKEWLFTKLNDYLSNKRPTDSNSMASKQINMNTNTESLSPCLLLLGDSGTGKSHLSCEMKWPTLVNDQNSTNLTPLQLINQQMISVYFLNWSNPNQNGTKQVFAHMIRSIQNFVTSKSIANLTPYKSVLSLRLDDEDFDYFADNGSWHSTSTENTEDFINEIGNEFIENILTPLKNFNEHLIQNNKLESDSFKNFFMLIDGIDDAILNSERLMSMSMKKNYSNEPLKLNTRTHSATSLVQSTSTPLSNSESLLMFFNKILPFFPKWLTLVITCKRCNERIYLKKHLSSVKYEKMSMDRSVNVNSLMNSTNQLKKQLNFSNQSSSSIADPNGTTNKTCEHLQSSLSSHSLKTDAANPQKQTNRLSTPVELCNAAHFANLKDIQTYILKRLDNDVVLKKKFNKSNAVELINLLLIKSNFCVLYVEKILDFILRDFISSNEIKSIPVTLNGFYLYLIQRIISSERPEFANKKDILYSIFGLCLLDPQPFDKTTIFAKLCSRFRHLSFDYFETLFDYIEPLLFRQANKPNKFILYHSSLIDWFTDVKFCTQSYLVNLPETHFTLALYYFNELKNEKLNTNHWYQFTFHLANSNPVMSKANLSYFNLICKPEIPDKSSLNEIKKSDKSPVSNNLLEHTNNGYEEIFFELVTKSDLISLKEILALNPKLETQLIKMTDAFDQNALLVSVKLNNPIMCEYLIGLAKKQGETDFLDHCDSSGWTPLRYSAWMGKESVVKVLLENGANVDACDSEGRTALRAACFSGHQSIVELLIKFGADPNKCDSDQRTVLHISIHMGHVSLVNYLLKKGSNIYRRDAVGRGMVSTCIYSTCTNIQTKIKIMKILISHGVDINEVEANGKSPLILATLENQVQLVAAMADIGADMDFIDNECYTAITYAAKNNLSEMVDYFLRKNAATHILDKNGRSVLSIACSYNSKQVVGQLMERGLDEMHRDNSGWTPLHEASYAGHLSIAQMLLDYGSEVNACDNDGKTSIYYACQQGYLDFVKLLLTREADLQARSHQGITPFRVACLYNRIEICQYLLTQPGNGDINYVDADGRTTLFSIIQDNSKNIDLIRVLLENGASVTMKDQDGRSSLHLAVDVGDEECFKLLISYHTNLELTDKNGLTPLQLAILNDKPNLIKMMLELKKIAINHQDKQGSTALSLACHKGNFDLVNQLLKHGAQIYASAKNPIKIAHQNGNENIVKLLQQSAAQCYNPALKKSPVIYENTPMTSAQLQGVPRNSKSFDSFKSKSGKLQSSESLMKARGSATPTSFSSYVKNTPSLSSTSSQAISYHVPNSFSNNKFDDLRLINQKNRSLINNLNSESKDPMTVITQKNENKSSRFKMVKEKLLRKPSLLSQQKPNLKQSKSIDSSVSQLTSNLNSLVASSPSGNTKSTSFRALMSSLNNKSIDPLSQSKYSMLNRSPVKAESNKDEIKRSMSFVQKRSTHMNTSNEKLKSSKSITNSTFYQMIRKKLRFLKNDHSLAEVQNDDDDGTDEFIFKNNQMPRSVTDASSIYLARNNPISESIQHHANSANQINQKEDDVAYIFNRNSLNDCLNPRSSFRDCKNSVQEPTYNSFMKKSTMNVLVGNSVGGTSSSSDSSNSRKSGLSRSQIHQQPETRNLPNVRPNNLPYFKKETSI